jgi:hypothetical protein
MSRYHSVIGRVIFALPIAILRICRAATAAKYLKIQIASGHSAEYINIREMLVRGYFRERALEARQESGLGEIKLAEKEPNDQTGQAQTLPLATSLGGKASSGDMENRSSLASSRRSRTSRRFRTAASSW